MVKVMICSLPGYGHVTPLLDVIGELTGRGHQVTVATGADFTAALAGVGARTIGYGPTADGATGAHAVSDALADFSGFLPALAPVARLLATDPPDIFAFDSTMWVAGRVLAAALSCPVVQLSPPFASNEHFSLAELVASYASQDSAAESDGPVDKIAELRATLEEAGLTGELGDMLSDAQDRKIVFLPVEFQFQGDTFDERHVFVGPCLGPHRLAGAWTPPANDDPVLLVSLGTSAFNNQPGFFTSCAEAFAGLPWNLVLTLGDGTDPDELRPLPANVTAHRWLPHPAVLSTARAFVTSGGMGSIMESLACDTPVVVVPHHGEQEANAQRVVELGLGKRLPRTEVSALAVRDAVLAVATDTSIAQRVHAMSEHCRRAGGAARAAEEILALA